MRRTASQLAAGVAHWLALWLAAATLIGCCCCTPDGSLLPEPSPWTPFQSAEGNFRVLFPAPVNETVTDDGKEHRFTASYRQGRRLLRAAYELDYDPTVTIADRFKAVAAMPGVSQVRLADIKLGDHPGMQADYILQDGGTTLEFRHRIYHVGGTSYQVMAVMHRGEEAQSDIDKFMNSFRLLSE